MATNLIPSYRNLNGIRFIEIDGNWISTAAIESISKPEEGFVELRMTSGQRIPVTGVYSVETFSQAVLGERHDPPFSR